VITLYARQEILDTSIDHDLQNGGMYISGMVSAEMAAITWHRNYFHNATLGSAKMEDQ